VSHHLPELAIGDVDGVNVDYETSESYVPGTLRVFTDGFIVVPTDSDGFTETGARTFQMKIPLLDGGRLQVMYDKP
jgi:hypothetical protein